MLHRAQDMLKKFQDRFRTTVNIVADIAESVGVPPSVTSLIQGLEKFATSEQTDTEKPPIYQAPEMAPSPQPPRGDLPKSQVEAQPAAPPAPVHEQPPPAESPQRVAAPPPAEKKRATGKKRGLIGEKDLSNQVRMLKKDDAIDGSTYLARIIWSLGIAELEETGALRPADMARTIMTRSPVSLEPPNVARYIRRSKPTCIEVDHKEGSSSFYKLNDEGRALFDEKFRIK